MRYEKVVGQGWVSPKRLCHDCRYGEPVIATSTRTNAANAPNASMDRSFHQSLWSSRSTSRYRWSREFL
ncbi:hypothetical protein XA26_35730 [Mycolicibacterium fortuitum]|uniref:Uncharacterized protein n=1 Tax=Mycolicibacterium fortuitum TaxID=1766 RepID=A0A0N9YHE0_MYCFO|nr:hypothetical protein XA26_35730 [Mycolicibacterium fortuitum]